MSPQSRSPKRTARRRESGMALALALCALTTIVVVMAAALLSGSAGIRATRNYRQASQVHFVAESGIAHAMQVANGPGVVNFQNDVVTQWTTLFGTGSRTFGPVPGYTYTVSSIVDPTNPVDFGRFIATATGPEGTQNVVVARVNRSSIPSTAPGSVYLSQDSPTNATFNGSAFLVDGNDHLLTGGLASPNHPIPGISTRNDTNTQEAISSLSSGERSRVTGLGFIAGSPAVPSILTSPAAPTVAQLNQIAADLISRAGVIVHNESRLNGNDTFGTVAAPVISYFNNPNGLTANGNTSGAGIMIVDGDLSISGSLNFSGLVIVRGRTTVGGTTSDTGNATLYGALWTNDVNLTVGGSAIIDYSSQGLALANQVSGGTALPAPVQLTSLIDCAQAVAGTAGCP